MQDLIRITSSALSRLVCVWVFKRGLFTVCQVWEASSSRASELYTCIFKDFLFTTAAKEDYNTWRQLSHHLKAVVRLAQDSRKYVVWNLPSLLTDVCFYCQVVWANQPWRMNEQIRVIIVLNVVFIYISCLAFRLRAVLNSNLVFNEWQCWRQTGFKFYTIKNGI